MKPERLRKGGGGLVPVIEDPLLDRTLRDAYLDIHPGLSRAFFVPKRAAQDKDARRGAASGEVDVWAFLVETGCFLMSEIEYPRWRVHVLVAVAAATCETKGGQREAEP